MRRVWLLLAVIAAAAILATTAFPLVALAAADAEARRAVAPGTAPSGSPTVGPSAGTQPKRADLGIRRLPLLSAAVEARISPDGILVDRATLTAVGQELAARYNLSWDRLLAITKDQRRGNGDLNEQLTYPEVEAYLSATGAKAKLSADVQGTVDLASLVALHGAANSKNNRDEFSGGIAQGLLLASGDVQTSCDKALNLAHIVLLSKYPSSERDIRYIDDAVAACPGDPTALWLKTEWARQGITSSGCEGLRFPRDVLPQAGLSSISLLNQQYPGSAIALASEAELLMTQAEHENYWGARPFTARSRWLKAESLLLQAMEVSSSPDLALSRAKALAGSGRAKDAAALVAALGAAASATEGRRVVATWVLASAGDFSRALQFAQEGEKTAAAASTAVPRTLSMSNDEPFIGGSLGVTGLMDSARVVLADAAPGYGGCGSSSVFDGGFLPQSRHVVFGPIGSGLYATRLADLAFLRGDDQSVRSACRQDGSPKICATITGDPDAAMAARQDLYRAAGRYDEAAQVSQSWLDRVPQHYRALVYLGEVRLLQKQTGDAQRALQAALQSDPTGRGLPTGLSGGWVRLRVAYAQQLQGAIDPSISTLNAARSVGAISDDDMMIDDSDALSYFKSLLLGRARTLKGDHAGALRDFIAASGFATKMLTKVHGSSNGVAEQNAALAASRIGDFTTAVDYANKALACDPASPLYIETLAEAQRGQIISQGALEAGFGSSSAGSASPNPSASPSTSATPGPKAGPPSGSSSLEQLIATYEKAVRTDPSLFSSWNNLGVLLAASGRHDDALDAFRQAVRARPTYALGWFNLGSQLLKEASPGRVIAAEGALGRAAQLEGKYRTEAPSLLFDEEIYSSGLDLSRMLPADWQLGGSARPSTAPLTLALLVILGLRVFSAFGQDTLASFAAEKLARVGGVVARGRASSWFLWPAWLGALLGGTALLYRGGLTGWSELLLILPFVAALVLTPMIVRRLCAAMPAPGVAERTPAVSVATSLILGLAGVAWPSVPGLVTVNDTEKPVRLARAVLVVVMTLIVASLLVSSIVSGVPVVRAAFMMSLATLGAILLPVPPAEGTYLKRLPGLAATGALAVVTVLTALNVA